MKLLQILVGLFLVLVCSDFVGYFLTLKSGGEPFEATGGKASQANITDDTCLLSPGVVGISQWLIGGLCVLSLFLLRLVFKKPTTKTVDATTSLSNDSVVRLAGGRNQEVHRKESLLNSNISEATFNCYSEGSSCETMGQLSPAQLQVLLEELKFSVDEKFEEMDSWISTNEQGSKLWGKRLERVERELSYIRHQLFILMSCSAKQSSSLCIGDVPDSKHHAETLKELSNILAQVKKQYNENESVDKLSGEKSGKPGEITSSRQQKVELDSTGNKVSNNYPHELQYVDSELNKSTLNSVSTSKSDAIKEIEEMKTINENQYTEKNINDERTSIEVSVDSEANIDYNVRNESNLISRIEERYPLANHANCSNNTFENSNMTIIKTLDCFNEVKPDLNRYSFVQGKVNEMGDTSLAVKENYNDLPLSGNPYYSLNSLMDDPSHMSTMLIDNTSGPMIESSMDIRQSHLDRSMSPKRAVRFAQGRDISPSKSPTWLSIQHSSPNRIHEKGISDSNVNEFTVNRGSKERRELSYPTVDTKRPSRRTILERELNILERSVSPSPTRNRTNLKHVRSKVGDYIRGHKKQIYEKINTAA